ncbi:hypothetical protein HN51_013481 [Arachis hypogaea]|uniref:BHLH domain-containing protein n=2 Tax=Arachis TaxID=3817 RepID=A0A445DQ40_ARAHY|nr:transcription factor bHLH61 [Arachis duranensis]XP_025690423.1 transcription factor bHLH61 [Arachis hypogaea]QHO59211.1 Transcription factor [Arachis hypogaea]RYR65280.1 hypothetical protein Ahy_A03g011224 [Arachis hypogaea]
MELSQLGFLEELMLAPRKDTWSSCTSNDVFSPSSWNYFDPFLDTPSSSSFPPSAFSPPPPDCPFTTSYPFPDDAFTMPDLDSSYTTKYEYEYDDAPPPPLPHNHQDLDDDNNNPSVLDDEDAGFLGCKVEEQAVVDVQVHVPVVFNMGMCGIGEKKNKSKKLEGQPSKNLMAERRRRKRLNDRLSMLRSIVPKISKMDRTSILGDTIDYMKELLERINKLQEEEVEEGTSQQNLLGVSKELKPNEAMVRNSPKFDVERRDKDTRISICCATKPGLLLSTVNTLEALGLEIQQCVISSFNDFSMQASCSEVSEQRNCVDPEEIKQALFRNAGYGGRCL